MIPRYAATHRGWLSATMASRDPRESVFGNPFSHGFGHAVKFGVGTTFDLIVALEFEGNVIWPALRAFDKPVVESGHGSWGIYTKNYLPPSPRRITSIHSLCLSGASKYARLKEIPLGRSRPPKDFTV